MKRRRSRDNGQQPWRAGLAAAWSVPARAQGKVCDDGLLMIDATDRCIVGKPPAPRWACRGQKPRPRETLGLPRSARLPASPRSCCDPMVPDVLVAVWARSLHGAEAADLLACRSCSDRGRPLGAGLVRASARPGAQLTAPQRTIGFRRSRPKAAGQICSMAMPGQKVGALVQSRHPYGAAGDKEADSRRGEAGPAASRSVIEGAPRRSRAGPDGRAVFTRRQS